jgi:hypothetical protein
MEVTEKICNWFNLEWVINKAISHVAFLKGGVLRFPFLLPMVAGPLQLPRVPAQLQNASSTFTGAEV